MGVFRKISLSLVLVVVLMFHSGIAALAHEERTPVIVDTDMAMDDVRALILMLISPRIEVKGIVTSDGASSPETGRKNVQRVLSFLGKEDIPIAAGTKLNAPPPPWREMSEALGWAKLPKAGDVQPRYPDQSRRAIPSLTSTAAGNGSPSAAASLVLKIIAESEQRVSYVGIGPLTNVAEVLRLDPSARSRISSIFYYGTSPEGPNPSWNTARDIEAAGIVFASGVPLYSIHLQEKEILTFDSALLEEIRKTGSPAARLLSLLYEDSRVRKLLLRNHFKVWDETVALYIDNPQIGSFEKASTQLPLFRLSKWEKEAARSDYVDVFSRSLTDRLEPRTAVVLKAYPSRPAEFQDDLRPLVPKIIALYGIEEWKAAVLTNEFHHHLGIYSILGAKMGILAREILNASLGDLTVESQAGRKPPLSCLTDGLQVSTGSSLGRGTITVNENGNPSAEAVFINGDRKLRLRLKDSVKDRIRADIQNAALRYGDFTPEYFKEIRRLAIEYWVKMKRDEIFDREPL